MFVEDLLHYSPLRLICAETQTSISEAVNRMEKFNIGLVVVMDENDRVAGVLSERDIVKGLANTGTALEETVVGDLMTESIITVSPTDTLFNAVLSMNTHRIRHLIVMQADKPVGVISIRDLLRVFADRLSDVKCSNDEQLKRELNKALAAV